jgi:glutaredoxin
MKTLPRTLFLAWVAATVCTPALALFKVIGPDGRVTYSDRVPPASQGRVMEVGRPEPPSNEVALPLALREATSRFPVILYTVPECPACDGGRELLRLRGVPYAERRADSDADREAWPRIVGSPEAPAMTIGAQLLSGFTPDQWHSYLDTAGYPRESLLPANYRQPPVAPIVARTPPAPLPAAAAPAEPPPPVPTAAPAPGPGGLRF